jgi:hypothetical protein
MRGSGIFVFNAAESDHGRPVPQVFQVLATGS